ncbi:hypothetical protein PR048_025055 [Dryococelus australis]|uniref:Integrase catalytic domain-containing protein n=1 Tax=Dryococelus australis TaxID=614101 RepID=A0ABQ9GQC5_9NEOP|nr:hypothetical protein PR048_025055 [Dryococelus australis]
MQWEIGKNSDVISLKLRKGEQPVFHRECDVLYALIKKVNGELDTLEAGVLTKAETSDWESALVVIPKADGVHLCVDYKVGVNEQLQDAHYPIWKIDDILNSLQNYCFFCQLNLIKAYLHVPVDEQSSEIQAISTHCGTYQLHRLSFSIKTASSEFNRIIDQIVRDIPKTMSYFDGIVHGSTREECQHNLIACLDQLQEFDLHLNQQKCLLFQEQIEYLGHVIEFNKISQSPGKVAAIVYMPRPKSTEDVRRFLGMVTYYSQFIHGASTIATPLRHLLCENTIFKWTSANEAAFLKLKQAIASDQILVLYGPDLPVQLACDASPTGIAGVLSHIVDGHDHPIAFASQSLTASEQNYSQLDREALATVFTVNHVFQYLFGHHFKLVTDNQLYTASVINNEVKQLCDATIKQINIPTVTYQLPKEEMKKNATLSTIMKSLQEEHTSETDYIIDGSGILFHGQRVVVPASLQSTVLNELHQTHVECIAIKKNPAKAPSHHWEEPEHNWQRIHIDYAGPYQDHHFLVVVDAKSKWTDTVSCSSAPTSKSSIEILKDIFSRNVFPEVMVSDNATIFTSEEFAHFFKEAGIFQEFCAAGHPVLKKLGKLHYPVELDNGFHFKSHIDQLRSTESLLPARKTVHFDPQPKSPMSDDRQLNKPNLSDLTEIMNPVVDFQPPA